MTKLKQWLAGVLRGLADRISPQGGGGSGPPPK